MNLLARSRATELRDRGGGISDRSGWRLSAILTTASSLIRSDTQGCHCGSERSNYQLTGQKRLNGSFHRNHRDIPLSIYIRSIRVSWNLVSTPFRSHALPQKATAKSQGFPKSKHLKATFIVRGSVRVSMFGHPRADINVYVFHRFAPNFATDRVWCIQSKILTVPCSDPTTNS